MSTATSIFQCELESDTLILTPQADLHELDYVQIEAEAAEILAFLDDPAVRHVVVDFHKTQYFGSTALGFFLKLRKKIRDRDGQLAFCNVSDLEGELFRFTKLDHLWPICRSRREALAAVQN
jgi:anti-anti-sigma factor